MSYHPILPTIKEQLSVALAFADVLRKQPGKRQLHYPFASPFCRHYFGKSRPSRSDLLFISDHGNQTVPEMMENLDRFLASNGRYFFLVDRHFAHRCFPSLKNSNEVRFENHHQMKGHQHRKIQAKQLQRQLEQLETMKRDIVAVSAKDLGQWVYDAEDTLSKHELMLCLSHWYANNDDSDYCFRDLYDGMTARQVAFDLSLPPEVEEEAANDDWC